MPEIVLIIPACRLTWTAAPFSQARDNRPSADDCAISHLAEVFQDNEGTLRGSMDVSTSN